MEVDLPEINTNVRIASVTGMLGLAGARSYEKKNKLTK